MVACDRPGSVIVDMAAVNGGNVEGAVADERSSAEVSRSSATPTSPVGCPRRPSQLFGTNLVNLMKLLTPEKDGRMVLDFDDVVQRSMTVVRDGAKTWPPPPVSVSAAPRPPRPRRGRSQEEGEAARVARPGGSASSAWPPSSCS